MGLCTEEKASCVPFLGLCWLKPGDPELLHDYNISAQERTQVSSETGLRKVKQREIKKISPAVQPMFYQIRTLHFSLKASSH